MLDENGRANGHAVLGPSGIMASDKTDLQTGGGEVISNDVTLEDGNFVRTTNTG